MKNLAIFSLFVVAAASQAQGTLVCGNGGNIPDSGAGVFKSSITIAAPCNLVSIILNDLNHGWVGDIKATFSGPSGTFDLFDRVGRVGSGFGDSSIYQGNYRFANGGGSLWTAATAAGFGAPVAAGTYGATTTSGTGVSLPATLAAGVYSLTIQDFATPDAGTLGSWCIECTPVPEPASMAVLGAGALALIRRRRSK